MTDNLTISAEAEDEVIDDDVVLQRYNSQLPDVYRSSLDSEQKLLNRALNSLLNAVLSASEANYVSSQSESEVDDDGATANLDEDAIVAEGYQHSFERDLAALEKGIVRYLDLKHSFSDDEFPKFFYVALRGAMSPTLDMGLRSKLARCASRLICKRHFVLPEGFNWRPIMHLVVKVHIQCADGGPFIGRDVRDSHCRNMLSLLTKSRNYLVPGDNAEKIWHEFSDKIHSPDVGTQFREMLLLCHVLPTRGESWSGWFEEGMRCWKSIDSSSDWDSIWTGLFSRLQRHQPCVHDITPHLSWIYSRITSAFRLPLGSIAPQSSIDRRCPHPLYFLMDSKTIPMAASLIVHSLSPKHPEALEYLERLVALIANYFHPSNSGRWSATIGAFLAHLSASLTSRASDERNATKAGILGRVLSSKTQKAIVPQEYRLPEEYLQKLLDLILPLVQHGLYSKVSILSLQASSAARDLALIRPAQVIGPFLLQAADGLGSISTPHRTTAALRLLSALTPVFLDQDFFPEAADYLPQALELTLPGIDPNDPGKTESTLRFIAGATARLQSVVATNRMPGIVDFMEGYIRQVLDRVFSLLESLETPPKKNASGSYHSGGSQLSFFMFSVAMDNLFGALPGRIAIQAANRIARQLTGSAYLNAKKYYGALVRTAASAAAAASGGSSAKIFIPTLVESLLDEESLVAAGENELVWRMRMLAQASRCVGPGLKDYLPNIATIIQLAFDRPSRPIYKAGGRLLRGVLEGMTSIQMIFGTGQGSQEDSADDGGIYKFDWQTPSTEDWKEAENLLGLFISRAEELSTTRADDGSASVTIDRDVLFRVLRMLHAIQRGGRWVLAGSLPESFKSLDKYENSDVEIPRKEAKLLLKRPIQAGLGGERSDGKGEEFATKAWRRIYSLISKIMASVVEKRPDDGALLYRCLEPIELAHEPFRRGERSRQVLHASRAYKAAYKPMIHAKRPFGSEGGVGRSMPRFIIKLRIEAHHEMRQSFAARGGMTNPDLCETILHQLTDMALNDFPRVRAEARGVLTKTLRIVRPSVRRTEILRILNVLRTSAPIASESNAVKVNGNEEKDAKDAMVIENGVSTADAKENDTLYEKMIGSSTILRSTAISPIIMRDWSLLTEAIKALIDSMPRAERQDGAKATTVLFARLSSLVRPLGLTPLRLVGEDLQSTTTRGLSSWEEQDMKRRMASYENLNVYLLSVLDMTPNSPVTADLNNEEKESGNEAHWRLQVLVATVLYIIVREDRPPPGPVARFFVQGMISDVVILRQICSKAVMLLLALHGRKEGEERKQGENFDDSPQAWMSVDNGAISAIGDVACTEEFARKLVHTLALDHDDGEGSSRSRFSSVAGAGGAVAFSNLSRTIDGDTSWMISGGRPWPTSWCPRSRDNISIVRIRFYETLVRVFGRSFYDAIIPTLSDLAEKLSKKTEKIMIGVKDVDVKVLAGEVLAGICRGLDLLHCTDNVPGETLKKLAVSLLGELSGPVGNVNGATLIRLISTSSESAIGSVIRGDILDWLLETKPVIVPMGNGPMAHLQARRLRYLHSCVADIDTAEEPRMIRLVNEAASSLLGDVGFDHEMKTVREEVARCLAKISVNVSDDSREQYDLQMNNIIDMLRKADEQKGSNAFKDDGEADSGENDTNSAKKSRSRQGETLSRFLSIVGWHGRARQFETYIPQLIPVLFASFDESDPERISHARMAMSFTAQGAFSTSTIDEIITSLEAVSNDERWKVRGSLLAFLQLLSFTSLFTAPPESLARIRNIVIKLLSDTHLEVRQAAASSFVTMIRDAAPSAVEEVRNRFMKVLSETARKRRGSKRIPMDADKMRRRHGAVLALSSMIVSSPYTIPPWMPSVLVGLSGCVNDGPPISTGVRKLFADFMRTHRDEWAMHKLAFTQDELEIVSELMVSPSYYA